MVQPLDKAFRYASPPGAPRVCTRMIGGQCWDESGRPIARPPQTFVQGPSQEFYQGAGLRPQASAPSFPALAPYVAPELPPMPLRRPTGLEELATVGLDDPMEWSTRGLGPEVFGPPEAHLEQPPGMFGLPSVAVVAGVVLVVLLMRGR
jgi:hypothetical protein